MSIKINNQPNIQELRLKILEDVIQSASNYNNVFDFSIKEVSNWADGVIRLTELIHNHSKATPIINNILQGNYRMTLNANANNLSMIVFDKFINNSQRKLFEATTKLL